MDAYDKVRLVPFGEYMPFRGLLPFEKLTAGSVDFAPGPARRSLEVPGLPPAGPLICYEAVFPGAASASGAAGPPRWLLVVTNDAWFGTSWGPYQHLLAARVRTVACWAGAACTAAFASAAISFAPCVGHRRSLHGAGSTDRGAPAAVRSGSTGGRAPPTGR